MSKSVIFTFGRMNPFTLGHEHLINVLIKDAQKTNADKIVFLSATQDNKKNPLTWEEKLNTIKEVFPNLTVCTDADIRTPFDAFFYLAEKYDRITMLVGGDRQKEFQEKMSKYAEEKGVKYFTVVSVGDRDQQSTISKVSASKARNYATQSNYKKFKTLMPKMLNNNTTHKLYRKIKERLSA